MRKKKTSKSQKYHIFIKSFPKECHAVIIIIIARESKQKPHFGRRRKKSWT